MAAPLPSLTEEANALTEALDRCDAAALWALLGAVDAQLFEGVDAAVAPCAALSAAVAAAVAAPDGSAAVVVSGAGTSGRLAAALCRAANDLLPRRVFYHLIAGGNAALLLARESAEDSAAGARADIAPFLETFERVVYVGVTCGLSAPYVAVQLHTLLDAAAARPLTVALLGFNPLERARRTPMDDFGGLSFADVAARLAAAAQREPARFLVLNPLVQPEAVTGSTRMKGGSATKMLLDAVLVAAQRQLAAPAPTPAPAPSAAFFRAWFEETRVAVQELYARNAAVMPALAELAAASIRRRRRVVYVAGSRSGVAATIDASECRPTFGARPDDVVSLLALGCAETLLGALPAAGQARDARIAAWARADELPAMRIDALLLPAPLHGALAELGAGDCALGLVLLGIDSDASAQLVAQGCRALAERGVATRLLVLHSSDDDGAAPDAGALAALAERAGRGVQLVGLVLPRGSSSSSGVVAPALLAELQLKLLLNYVSTAAFVLAGKVFRNRMIDVRISNSKLFERACGIVATVAACTRSDAQGALLASIYECSPADDGARIAALGARPVAEHVAASAARERVVPLAVLLATGRFTLAEAQRALERDPQVRSHLGA